MRQYLFISILGVFLMACSTKNAEIVAPAVVEKAPEAVELSKPANSSVCFVGSNAGADEVQFTWVPVSAATSYDLKITNLAVNYTETKNFTTSPATVKLVTGIPYEWQVISKSSKTSLTSSSAKWKFYLTGSGEISYAPFPASLRFPASGANVTAIGGNVKLSWVGSDPDSGNSLLSYEIFVDTELTKVKNREVAAQKSKTETLTIPVKSGGTYYWMVKTSDGNSASFSAVYGFRVN
jgi:hypothetical protein